MTTDVWNTAESLRIPTAQSLDDADRLQEQAMLDRCALGEERAIRWVLQQYRARVIRVASHILRNRREAEDVAQEAFLKAFRHLAQYRGNSRFYLWLYRIVVN